MRKQPANARKRVRFQFNSEDEPESQSEKEDSGDNEDKVSLLKSITTQFDLFLFYFLQEGGDSQSLSSSKAVKSETTDEVDPLNP